MVRKGWGFSWFSNLRPSAVKGVLGTAVNIYLFLAFAACWLIFMLYAWLLSRRQAQLQRELEELKSRFQKQQPAEHHGK